MNHILQALLGRSRFSMISFFLSGKYQVIFVQTYHELTKSIIVREKWLSSGRSMPDTDTSYGSERE